MKIALALLLLPLSALANDTDYYTKPDHPGRHYDCTKPTDTGEPRVVAYENDRIIILCENFSYKRVWPKGWRRLVKPSHWEWTADGASFLVKSPANVQLDPQQITAAIDSQMREPFYDSSERRMIRWQGITLAADFVTTAYGIKVKGCKEKNPIFAQAPVIGVAYSTWLFLTYRANVKKTPRFFTGSREFEPWVPVASHGAAAASNLFNCIL